MGDKKGKKEKAKDQDKAKKDEHAGHDHGDHHGSRSRASPVRGVDCEAAGGVNS